MKDDSKSISTIWKQRYSPQYGSKEYLHNMEENSNMEFQYGIPIFQNSKIPKFQYGRKFHNMEENKIPSQVLLSFCCCCIEIYMLKQAVFSYHITFFRLDKRLYFHHVYNDRPRLDDHIAHQNETTVTSSWATNKEQHLCKLTHLCTSTNHVNCFC